MIWGTSFPPFPTKNQGHMGGVLNAKANGRFPELSIRFRVYDSGFRV